jgi:exopolysaccharide biosynthesis protein
LATTISLQTKTKKSIQLQFQKTKLEISKSTDKTVYFWEVSTTTGSASGYAMSEAQALKQSN